MVVWVCNHLKSVPLTPNIRLLPSMSMYTIDINAVVAGVYWLQLQSAVMRTRHSGKRANFPAQCHDTHWFTHSRCCHVTESKIYIFKCKQHIVTGFHVSTRSLLHMLHCHFSIAAQIGQTDCHTTGWENGFSALYHMLITNVTTIYWMIVYGSHVDSLPRHYNWSSRPLLKQIPKLRQSIQFQPVRCCDPQNCAAPEENI